MERRLIACGVLLLLSCITPMRMLAEVVHCAERQDASRASSLCLKQKALIKAIRDRDFKTFDRLLDGGLNPNYLFGQEKISPLSESIAERQPRMLASLLTHRADVNFGAEAGLVPL